MKWIAALLVLAGCPVDRQEVGPKLHVLLDSMVTDTEATPMIFLNGSTSYSIDVEVDVSPGTDDNGMTMNTFPSTGMTATMTVPGVTIADSPFLPDDVFDEIDYRRKDPLTLPATAMGKALMIHAEAMDSRGLQSNILDFSVALH